MPLTHIAAKFGVIVLSVKKVGTIALACVLSAVTLCGCSKYSKGDKLVTEAVQLYKQQDYNGAKELLLQAEKDGLKSAGEELLYFYLGEAYFKLGDHSKSLEAHLKVVEIKPEAFKSWVTIGVCKRKLGDSKGALDAYLNALMYDPENADSVGLYISLGSLYIENGKPYTAIDYLEKAAEIYPEHPAAHAFLAIAYAMAYDHDKAEAEFTLAEQLGFSDMEGIRAQINKVKAAQQNIPQLDLPKSE